MKKIFNSKAILFLALTAFLVIYRALWREGLPDFYAAVVGCAVAYAASRYTRTDLMLGSTGRKMTLLLFLTLLGITMLGQLLGQVYNDLLEKGLNLIGYTMNNEVESVQKRELFTDVISNLTRLFWPILLGPAVEELLYRSYACKELEKDGGKVLAIVVTALAFSLSHGRLYLTAHTFISGFVLGFLIFEFGLKWSIIFHVINNLGIVGLNLLLCVIFGDKTGALVNNVIGILFSLFAVVVIFLKRREIGEYITANKAPAPGAYGRAFFNVGFLVFLAYNLYISISHVVPM